MSPELARHFLVALLIGALVGIEREKRKHAAPGRTLGGIRTHILLALVGGASAWLAREIDMPWVLVVTLAAVAAVGVASYVRRSSRGPQDDSPGITSEIAAIAVFLLGAMVVLGNEALAVALAITVSAVLAFKQPLHGFVQRIGVDDLLAGIKLLIASFIVLPLVPDATVDPWQAINPYQLWLLVVLISALSLVGYVAMRWLGPTRGTAVTGIAGGLLSSTAATLGFARNSRAGAPGARGDAASAGILLAWLVMFLRVVIVAAIVGPRLLQAAWPPLAAMALVTAGLAAHHYRAGIGLAGAGGEPGLEAKNPFNLAAAVRFGALFAGVLLAVKIAQQHLPGLGLYVVSALAGSMDVDAITLSLASDAGAGDLRPAALALVMAVLANTAVKCAMVLVLGAGPVRRHVAVASALIAAAGAIAAFAAR